MADAEWATVIEHSDIKLGRIGHWLLIEGDSTTCIKAEVLDHETRKGKTWLTIAYSDVRPQSTPVVMSGENRWHQQLRRGVIHDPSQTKDQSFHLTRECKEKR